jgi:Fur family transcriptional regulator, ferric uptake regulator
VLAKAISQLRLTGRDRRVISKNMQQETAKPNCRSCSPQGTCRDVLRNKLAVKGGRLTEERVALLHIVCNTKGHFRPEDLLKALDRQSHRVSLTTVYRNLSLLVEAGIIRRTDVQDTSRLGGAWFERVWGKRHHDHLICSRCGKRVEFSYPAIDVLQDAVAQDHGFTLERHCLELVGVCPECKRAGKEVE